jgi:hypothetical protein
MSMVYPKDTEGYYLIEESLRRRVELPKADQMFQSQFKQARCKPLCRKALSATY